MYKFCPLFSFVIVAAFAVTLSGCGGGGTSDGTPANEMPGAGSQPASLTENQLYGDIDVYREVAANSPNFGSITQSSNGNGGISTDRVETLLDANGGLTVTVRDGNGAVSLQLDSRQHEHTNLNGTAWMNSGGEDFPSNWDGNAWVLANQDGEDTVVSLAYVAWEDTDTTNYLAGGYWIRGNETEGVTEMGTFGDAGSGSIFAYYDGQNSSWERPISGTATYRGEAEGAYAEPGGDVGVWWSMSILNADFTTNSISGCAGCPAADPSGDERGIYTYSTIEDLKKDRWTEEGLYIALNGTGNIRNDGSFEGTLKVKDYFTDNELASGGKWGGLFSENSNSASSPEQAFGTLSGTTGEYGFVGVFHGQR